MPMYGVLYERRTHSATPQPWLYGIGPVRLQVSFVTNITFLFLLAAVTTQCDDPLIPPPAGEYGHCRVWGLYHTFQVDRSA